MALLPKTASMATAAHAASDLHRNIGIVVILLELVSATSRAGHPAAAASDSAGPDEDRARFLRE
jgi:hypothetical protein